MSQKPGALVVCMRAKDARKIAHCLPERVVHATCIGCQQKVIGLEASFAGDWDPHAICQQCFDRVKESPVITKLRNEPVPGREEALAEMRDRQRRQN